MGPTRESGSEQARKRLVIGSIYGTIKMMIGVSEYLDEKGNSPYAKWFDRINVAGAVKVAAAIHRMVQGTTLMLKVPASMNTGLISAPAIGFTLAKTGTGL